MLEVLYHHAKFGVARISPAAGTAKNVEFLSVSRFVRHAHAAGVHGMRTPGGAVRREF